MSASTDVVSIEKDGPSLSALYFEVSICGSLTSFCNGAFFSSEADF